MKLEVGDIVQLKDGSLGKITVANEYWCVVKLYQKNRIIKQFYREIEKVKEKFIITYEYGARDIFKLHEKALTIKEAQIIKLNLKKDRLVNNIRIMEA